MHRVADQVDGRFVASDIQQNDKRHQFVVVEFFALLFDADQRREHVVAHVFATVADDLVEIRPHFIDRDLTFFEIFDAGSWFKSCGDDLRPFAQLIGAISGHCQQI